MNDDITQQLLLVGLPSTGKTSFLAGVIHYIESSKNAKKFKQYKESANTEYLSKIVKSWLRCEEPERMSSSAGAVKPHIELFLEETEKSKKIVLEIPDIAGEAFESQFIHRTLDIDYVEKLKNTTSLMLFINPTKIESHMLINDINLLACELELDSRDEKNILPGKIKINNSGSPQLEDEIVSFSSEKCPTQLILFDLLQNELDLIPVRPVLLSIVISAWDKVPQIAENNVTPEDWIQIHMPLFHQYLMANPEIITHKVFGVSAQGGDFKNKDEVERLTAMDDACLRIKVQEGESIHNNICAPIEWLLNNE